MIHGSQVLDIRNYTAVIRLRELKHCVRLDVDVRCFPSDQYETLCSPTQCSERSQRGVNLPLLCHDTKQVGAMH